MTPKGGERKHNYEKKNVANLPSTIQEGTALFGGSGIASALHSICFPPPACGCPEPSAFPWAYSPLSGDKAGLHAADIAACRGSGDRLRFARPQWPVTKTANGENAPDTCAPQHEGNGVRKTD